MNNAPSTTQKEPSSTMIYVSNLPFTTKDEELRELFKDFEIKTAYVATRRNGRSKGFGFVNLAKEGDQKKAIEKVDGHEFAGRKITAKIAFNDDRRNERGELKEQFKKQLPTKQEGPPSETAVYVSNLPWSYKDEDLKKLFGNLTVKNATVALRRSGKSKGFGFVEFATNEDQKKALLLDQTKAPNFDEKKTATTTTSTEEKKAEDRVISVKASVNYRGANNQPKFTGGNTGGNFGRGRGPPRRGPRNFSNNRTGSNNRSGSNNSNSNNSNSSNNNNNNRSNRPPIVTKPNTARTENALYVSNLPFDLDNEDLKQIFSEFGVKNANVATRQNGRSLGFGFVEFNNQQDQRKALEGLDQSEVNGRTITVKIATGRKNNNNNNNNSSRRPIVRRNNNNNNNNNYHNNNNNNRNRSRSQNNNRRRNVSNEKREPSSTMVYVSNLPFSVDDKSLAAVFTGFKVNKAYVASRRNGRSKGFGFVDFGSSEDQQKALKLNGQEVDGRPLTIQIANKVEAKQEGASN